MRGNKRKNTGGAPDTKRTCILTDEINPLRPAAPPDALENLSVDQLLGLEDFLRRVDDEYRALHASPAPDAPPDDAPPLRGLPWDDAMLRQRVAEPDADSNLQALRASILESARAVLESNAPALPFSKQDALKRLMESTSAAIREGAFRQLVADMAHIARDHSLAHAAVDFLASSKRAEATVALRRELCEVRGVGDKQILVRQALAPALRPDDYIGRRHFLAMLQPPRGAGERACVNGETCAAVHETRPWLRIEGSDAPRRPCREYVEPWRTEPRTGPVGPCLWCMLRMYEMLFVAFTASLDAPPLAPGIAFKKGDGADDFPAPYFYPDGNGPGGARPTGMGNVVQARCFHLQFSAGPPAFYQVLVHFFGPRRGRCAPPGSSTAPRPSSAATL